jgi:hypothetical protein
MSHAGVFVAGVVVTLIVIAALALLVMGAILDGRDEARRRSLREREPEVRPANLKARTDRVPPHAA